MVPTTAVDPSLVTSQALTLAQGTIASGANRFDANVIAKYEFQTGTGLVAYDTSGVDPSADLSLSGSVSWAGGWGITVGAGGKAQASTSSSKKIHDLIEATGEYTVEAWVAPAWWRPTSPTWSAIRAATPCAISRWVRPIRTTTS
jgi:hypothetical protein